MTRFRNCLSFKKIINSKKKNLVQCLCYLHFLSQCLVHHAFLNYFLERKINDLISIIDRYMIILFRTVAICMLCLLTFMSYLRTGCLCFHCLSWLKRFPSWDLYFLRYYLKDGLEIIIELCLSPFLCQAETIPIAALLCPQLGPIFDNQHRFGAKLSSFHLQIELLPQI